MSVVDVFVDVGCEVGYDGFGWVLVLVCFVVFCCVVENFVDNGVCYGIWVWVGIEIEEVILVVCIDDDGFGIV
ncbi:two-component sensor histidine kinase, partial [Enterococcus hirae]